MTGGDDTKKINSWICIWILRPYANVVSSFFHEKRNKKKNVRKKENEDFFFSFLLSKIGKD